MHDYITSETYYFKETGQKVQAGQTVTLSRGAAERYMQSHPGLLRPAMVTTQREIKVIRSTVSEAPATTNTAEASETPVVSAEPVAEVATPKTRKKK